MKHLFIINAQAGQVIGRVNEIKDSIRNFFLANPSEEYDIHVSRWKRDAIGYTRRILNSASEIVRVYALGGGGTLFEVLNGVIGMPNAQIAWYPLGNNNYMLDNLNENFKISAFQSLQNLTFSPVITLDTVKAGNHYMITNALIGAEAEAYSKAEEIAKKYSLPGIICNLIRRIFKLYLNKHPHYYNFSTESIVKEGKYYNILIANIPGYGTGIRSVGDSSTNDGYMDVYAIKPLPFKNFYRIITDCKKGYGRNWPQYIEHFRCKRFTVSSDSSMIISLDGEFFYETLISFANCPASLYFAAPMVFAKEARQ